MLESPATCERSLHSIHDPFQRSRDLPHPYPGMLSTKVVVAQLSEFLVVLT